MSVVSSCIFCQIVAGEADASLVYQDDLVSAFMDLFPAAPGHLLVIPNAHAAYVSELAEATGARVFLVGKQVGQALRQSMHAPQAVSFYLADGPAAGQVIPHVHLHVIPRSAGDRVALHLHSIPPGKATRERLDEQAAELSAILENPIEGRR